MNFLPVSPWSNVNKSRGQPFTVKRREREREIGSERETKPSTKTFPFAFFFPGVYIVAPMIFFPLKLQTMKHQLSITLWIMFSVQWWCYNVIYKKLFIAKILFFHRILKSIQMFFDSLISEYQLIECITENEVVQYYNNKSI